MIGIYENGSDFIQLFSATCGESNGPRAVGDGYQPMGIGLRPGAL